MVVSGAAAVLALQRPRQQAERTLRRAVTDQRSWITHHSSRITDHGSQITGHAERRLNTGFQTQGGSGAAGVHRPHTAPLPHGSSLLP
eukprot:2163259-Rhodomonas_salina.3